MNDKPIIALDFPNEEKVLTFLNQFEGPLYVKVGMELYLQEGPSIVHKIKELGHDIFLDLKLHDIPNTVKSAMTGLAKLGVNLINVHAAGGKQMMEAALEGLDIGTPAGNIRPKLIAVTQLTSTSEEQMQTEQKIPLSIVDSVLHYAQLTKSAGLDGVVCSVLEANAIKEVCGESFLRVTPGIRLAGSTTHDQIRIATPAIAKEKGASIIVVGRSITGSDNPKEAYQNVYQQWGGQTK